MSQVFFPDSRYIVSAEWVVRFFSCLCCACVNCVLRFRDNLFHYGSQTLRLLALSYNIVASFLHKMFRSPSPSLSGVNVGRDGRSVGRLKNGNAEKKH